MEKFEDLGSLGEGGQGEVSLVKSTKDGKLYAKKKMKNGDTDKTAEIEERRSQDIFKYSKYKDINLTSYRKTEENELICPFYNGGNLHEFIEKNKHHITIEMIQHIMKNIIHGLYTLHSLGFIHRDIKSHNLMIDYNNENDKNILNSKIIIIDFGHVENFKYNKSLDDNYHRGTVNYRHLKVNEIRFNLCEQSQKDKLKEEIKEMNVELDIWGLGIVFMELLTGKKLFDYPTEKVNDKVRKELDESNVYKVYKIPFNGNTSIELVSFIDEILQYETKYQSTIEKLLDHEFIKKDVKDFTPFPRDKAKEKLKIEDNNIEYLELNLRKGPNFVYKELYPPKQEDLDALINKIFISLNEESLFTDQILIPIIPQS